MSLDILAMDKEQGANEAGSQKPEAGSQKPRSEDRSQKSGAESKQRREATRKESEVGRHKTTLQVNTGQGSEGLKINTLTPRRNFLESMPYKNFCEFESEGARGRATESSLSRSLAGGHQSRGNRSRNLLENKEVPNM